MQSEYSLCTRNPELRILDTCHELGVAFVAFSPLARAFLTGTLRNLTLLPPADIRRKMPRFQQPHFERNLALLEQFERVAHEHSCTPAQLALAWLLARCPEIIAIPGTTCLAHLEENFAVAELNLPPEALVRADSIVNRHTVSGPRYDAVQQREIDTEEFPNAA